MEMGHFCIRLHNGNLKHSARVGAGKMFNGPELVQSLTDVRKGCVRRKFTQVEFYLSRNFPKFNQFNFLSHTQQIYLFLRHLSNEVWPSIFLPP
jgi:hypothetical protein